MGWRDCLRWSSYSELHVCLRHRGVKNALDIIGGRRFDSLVRPECRESAVRGNWRESNCDCAAAGRTPDHGTQERQSCCFVGHPILSIGGVSHGGIAVMGFMQCTGVPYAAFVAPISFHVYMHAASDILPRCPFP